MLFKGNPEKRKKFILFNFKRLFALIAKLIPFFVITTVAIAYVSYSEFKQIGIGSSSIAISTIVISTIAISLFVTFCVIIPLSIFFVSLFLSKNLVDWEIDIQDNYLILRNPSAITTVSFADFKSYKEKKDSIIFKIGFLKSFYCCWDIFFDSDELKKQLLIVASKIGNYESAVNTDSSLQNAKTKVQFKSKKRIIVLIALMVSILLLRFFLNKH